VTLGVADVSKPGAVTLNWTTTDVTETYIIQYWRDGVNDYALESNNKQQFNSIINNLILTGKTKYWWSVKAYCSGSKINTVGYATPQSFTTNRYSMSSSNFESR